MKTKRVLFLLLSWILLCAPALQKAEAALPSQKDALSPESVWNPHPNTDDITLPMPCNLHLALRAVAIPAGNTIQDRRLVMGISANRDSQRQIYERRFEAHIAAPFAKRDLPPAWNKALAREETEHHRFYFIGKYEITEAQWDAVMNDQCPASLSPGGNLPKRDISWYEMQLFLRKYNAWLTQNAPESLPVFADNPKNIGFLRLPTEEEWEFAARGGNRVPEETRNHAEIFPLGDKSLADFAVITTPDSIRHTPLPIGSRLGNPLGIYDMLGNVKELVQGFFRFSIADRRGDGEIFRRLHGSSGGMICKGGGFLSDDKEALPGWRDEIALFTRSGEGRNTDLGMRVALSGINIPSGQRLNQLIKESGLQVPPAAPPSRTVPPVAASTPASGSAARDTTRKDLVVSLNPSGNPIFELDRISDAAATPEMRANLSQLRSLLEDQARAETLQREAHQENSLRALLYQAESLRNTAYRYWVLNNEYTKMKNRLSQQQKKILTNTMKEFFDVLQTSTNFYKTEVARLSGASKETTQRLLAQIRQEYGGKDVLSEHMRQNIDSLKKHLSLSRQREADAITNKELCRDILPTIHYRILPF